MRLFFRLRFAAIFNVVIITAFLFSGCAQENELNSLQQQINELHSTQISSLIEQISSIRNSIDKLESADAELQNYIQTLEEQRANLERTDQALSQSIQDLKAELYGAISEEKASIFAQMTEDKNALQQSIQELQVKQAALEAKDTSLEAKDDQLQRQIDSIKNKIGILEGLLTDVTSSISVLESELRSQISASENNVLAQLDAYKEIVATQIASLNTSISSLVAKDEDLQTQINNLQSYVDGEIQDCKDWASATFATLEQYNATTIIITGIQAQISTINGQISQLTEVINTLASKDELGNALSSLDASLQLKIQTAVNNCDAAISTAQQEITAAYTTAIQNAIAASETSIKTWVNEQLTGYYTIAETDAAILTLKNALESQLNSQKAYLEGLITSLEASLNSKINGNQTLIENLQLQLNGISSDISSIVADVLTNSTNIAKNASDIAANARAISQSAADIDSCKTLIAANKTLIEGIQVAVNKNAEDISALNNRISEDEALIANQATSIAQNASAISDNARLISTNATAITNNAAAISNNAADIAQLREDVSSMRSEITDAYTAAISTAISTLDGNITGQIATEVSNINTRITNEISTINDQISSLSSRVATCESDILSIKSSITEMIQAIEQIQAQISLILSRIQSLTYVPRYADGKARVFFNTEGESIVPDRISLDFELRPHSVAAELTNVWQTALSLKAVSTITKAGTEFTNLEITSFDASEGILSLTADVNPLGANFFNGKQSASACLSISDGHNDISSDYIPLLAVERVVKVSTLPATNIVGSSATLNAKVGSGELVPITEVGFFYSSAYATAEALVSNGKKIACTRQEDNTFSANVSGLSAGNVFYVGYAIIGDSVFSGEVRAFTVRGEIDGAVDLGLSVLWGMNNVGAENPEDYGSYYSWGDLSIKEFYASNTYTWYHVYNYGTDNEIITLNKYNNSAARGTVDNLTRVLLEDDIAHQKKGGKWRMPTEKEWRELIKNCEWSKAKVNNIDGLVAARGDNSIFLPLAGHRFSNLLYYLGQEGNYWSSDLCLDNPLLAISFYESQGADYLSTNYFSRFLGYSVRPVYDPGLTLVTGIEIDKTTLSLTVNEISTISVSAITPTNATYNMVRWTSSAPHIATVDCDGNVQGLLAGTAEIRAEAVDGTGVYASCTVTVKNKVFVFGEVDLGLSSGIQWANANLGATTAEGYGDYYAWGETENKSNYDWSTYKWCNGSASTLTKYNDNSASGSVDNKSILDLEDDAAHVALGGSWRMPTAAEWDELLNECTWTWVTENGVKCRIIEGPNGNSIILPAAGSVGGTNLEDLGTGGSYWSSELGSSGSSYAWSIGFVAGRDNGYRYRGRSVRPVYDPNLTLVSGISLNKSSLALEVGEQSILSVSAFTPSNATYKAVNWTSSNSSIATVDCNGLVSAIAPGTAVIKAKAVDGTGAYGSCSVTVTATPSANSYLVWRKNTSGGWDATNENYRRYESYLYGFSAAKVEMKFQLASSTENEIPIASTNTAGDKYKLFSLSTTHLDWKYIYDSDTIDDETIHIELSDSGTSRTDMIMIRFDAAAHSIIINGYNYYAPFSSFDFTYLFADYYREYDEGECKIFEGIPDGSKIYYVKGWDANGNLIYNGYPFMSTYGDSSTLQYCWRVDSPSGTTYKFANDAANQGHFGGHLEY